MTSSRIALMTERLAGLDPLDLRIEDESHLHAGHAGAQGGAGHYRVHICAEIFRGKSPIARHRLVYDRLTDLMPHAIHALAIHASAPPAASSVSPSSQPLSHPAS